MARFLLDDDKPYVIKMVKLVNQPLKIGGQVAKDFQGIYLNIRIYNIYILGYCLPSNRPGSP